MSKNEKEIVEWPRTAEEMSKLTPTQIADLQKKFKARFADVAFRGSIPNRLRVDNMPEHLYGEWVHNDPASIRAKQDLGFVIDTEYAPKTGLHGDDNQAVVFDVVHMIAPKFVRDSVIEEQRRRREMIHGVQKDVRTAEDIPAEDGLKNELGNQPIQVVNESKTSSADADAIARALK